MNKVEFSRTAKVPFQKALRQLHRKANGLSRAPATANCFARSRVRTSRTLKPRSTPRTPPRMPGRISRLPACVSRGPGARRLGKPVWSQTTARHRVRLPGVNTGMSWICSGGRAVVPAFYLDGFSLCEPVPALRFENASANIAVVGFRADEFLASVSRRL
jgi:hypothetical protein